MNCQDKHEDTRSDRKHLHGVASNRLLRSLDASIQYIGDGQSRRHRVLYKTQTWSVDRTYPFNGNTSRNSVPDLKHIRSPSSLPIFPGLRPAIGWVNEEFDLFYWKKKIYSHFYFYIGKGHCFFNNKCSSKDNKRLCFFFLRVFFLKKFNYNVMISTPPSSFS